MSYFIIKWTTAHRFDPLIDSSYFSTWEDKDIKTAKNNWQGWNREKNILKIEEVSKTVYDAQRIINQNGLQSTLYTTNCITYLGKILGLLQEYHSEVTGNDTPDWFPELDIFGNVISIWRWEGDKKISLPFEEWAKQLWNDINQKS